MPSPARRSRRLLLVLSLVVAAVASQPVVSAHAAATQAQATPQLLSLRLVGRKASVVAGHRARLGIQLTSVDGKTHPAVAACVRVSRTVRITRVRSGGTRKGPRRACWKGRAVTPKGKVLAFDVRSRAGASRSRVRVQLTSPEILPARASYSLRLRGSHRAVHAVAREGGPTDILLLFDTTGSMGDALSGAQAQMLAITSQIDASLTDVRYGVAQVCDYPLYTGNEDDQAYSVVQPMTTDRDAIANAVNGLNADGGGDNPEAYGGALLGADLGTGGLGWRPGARRLVILVADDLPHDDDLDAGIGDALQIAPSPFDSGVDPGPDGSVGTADDIDWQPLLQRLANDGIPLMYVLFKGEESYLPYWQLWAGITGGGAAQAGDDSLGTTIVSLAQAGATGALPPCPAGQSRNADGVCAVVAVPVAPVGTPTPPTGSTGGGVLGVSTSSLWGGVTHSYSTASLCAADAGDVKGGWRTLVKSLRCVGSGQVFFDPDLKDKAKGSVVCVVNVSVDVASVVFPVAKLKAVAKSSKVFAEEARAAARTLRSLAPDKTDRELIEQLDLGGAAWEAFTEGSVVEGTGKLVQSLVTSRAAAYKLQVWLKTSANRTALKQLRRTQKVADDLFKEISGINDVEDCEKLFSP